MPANEYRQHQFSFPAFDMLFGSGNHPSPPLGFSDSTDFDAFIRSKNFRGAMRLTDIKVYYDDDSIQEVTFDRLEMVGYTPMRISLSAVNPNFLCYFSRGVGSSDCSVTFDGDWAKITQWLRFKVGKIANYGMLIMTGQKAPSAWMKIDYTVYRNNAAVEIEFSGTYFPSQSYYVSWSRASVYDMLGNTSSQIDDFLNAGDCLDAPGDFHYTWRGCGQRCNGG